MWGELRKLRSNAAIRISLLHYRETNLQNCESCEATQQFVYHYIYYRETNIENCESCEATQQFVYHYILQENRFAELRKLRSNEAIRISLLHYGEQILRIARIAKQ